MNPLFPHNHFFSDPSFFPDPSVVSQMQQEAPWVKPLFALKETDYSSEIDLIKQIDIELSLYNTNKTSSSISSDKLQRFLASWEVYLLEAQQKKEEWNLIDATIEIILYKCKEYYVVTSNRLTGNSLDYTNFITKFRSSMMNSRPEEQSLNSFMPEIEIEDEIEDEEKLHHIEQMVLNLFSGNVANDFNSNKNKLSIAINTIHHLARYAAHENTELSARATSIVTKVIDYLLTFIDDNSDYHNKNEDPNLLCYGQKLTRVAVQAIYVLSQYPELFDQLKLAENLESYLTALSQYQSPDHQKLHIHSHMQHTVHLLLNKLSKYKDLSQVKFLRSSLEGLYAKVLMDKLLPSNLIIKPVPGDKNCLYNSVRLHLEDKPSVQEMRDRVADFVLEHRSDYEALIEGSFNNYIRGIKTNAWGDNIEINALMNIYQHPIYIFQQNGEPMIYPENVTQYTLPPIPIFYNNVNHYNAIDLGIDFKQSGIDTVQDALKTPNEPINEKLPSESVRHIASYLDTPYLCSFFGGSQQSVELAEQFDSEKISQFSSSIKLSKAKRTLDFNDTSDASDAPPLTAHKP